MSAIRPLLALFSVCWLLVGVANLEVSVTQRWHPEVVGFLSLGCAMCTATMALAPRVVIAFRLGGTLAIGTLCARVASIVLGALQIDSSGDTPWITLTTASVAMMLAVLYWRWWLTDVKAWHQAHKMIGRLSHDSG